MNAELSFEEWKAIRASVEREYRRAYSRTVKGKELAESSHERWKVLIKKINAHLEMSAREDRNERAKPESMDTKS